MLKSCYTLDQVEAGCDEAGRGPLAGPVVAAAVILPKDYKHNGLDDSKKLSRKNRIALKLTIEKEAIAWGVAVISHTQIDQINILKASFLAMHEAVKQLEVRPELLLIDGNRFNPFPGIAHKCIVKGDSKFLSIAAASILAKTYRDDIMEKLAIEYPQYGWESNAGYPTKAHREAIRKYGPTPYHRKSFRLLPEQQSLFDE